MRNIAQYPITNDEIVACLERLQREAMDKIKEKVICGDMTPALLDRAIQMVILYAEAEKATRSKDKAREAQSPDGL